MSEFFKFFTTGRSDMKKAMVSTALCAGLFVALYVLGGRDFIESSQIEEDARRAQEAAAEQLRQSELTAAQLQGQMSEVRAAMHRGETQDQDGKSLKDRLAAIEQQLLALPGLSEQTRAELDAAASRRAIARAKLIEADALTRRCFADLNEVIELEKQWSQSYVTIFDDDRGRKIAADQKAVAEIATLLKSQPPTNADLTSWYLQLSPVASNIQYQMVFNQDYLVTSEDQAFLEQFRTRVADAKTGILNWQSHFDRLLQQTESASPAELTLRDAIPQYEQKELAEMARVADEKRKAELQRVLDEQAAETQRIEAERLKAEAELKRAELEAQRAELARQKQEAEDQVEAAKALAARKKLEAEFKRDSAEISSLLFPFLYNGESQPTFGPIHDPRSWHTSGKGLGPTSFSALQAAGALDDSSESLLRLYFIGGDFNNLRKKGGFPRYEATGLNNSAVASRVSRARELLLKYGPLLVERRMLAP